MRRVFGIGLGKTGTRSLATAMRLLGYKSKHGVKYIDDFEHFEFVDDISTTWRYKFLDYCFPRAKFILTVRDEDSWIESNRLHSNVFGRDRLINGETNVSSERVRIPLRRAENRWQVYGVTYFDEEVFRQVHKVWDKQVKKHFKGREDKLLVLRICDGEGWEKLCPFLGEPIPDRKFPWQNRRQ